MISKGDTKQNSDSAYQNTMKGTNSSKNKPKGQFNFIKDQNTGIDKELNSKEYLGSRSGKFIPSNLTGFCMPYIGQQNEESNQYGYDIDIDNNVKEEGKYSKKPPLNKHYSRDEEDDIAVPLEDNKINR